MIGEANGTRRFRCALNILFMRSWIKRGWEHMLKIRASDTWVLKYCAEYLFVWNSREIARNLTLECCIIIFSWFSGPQSYISQLDLIGQLFTGTGTPPAPDPEEHQVNIRLKRFKVPAGDMDVLVVNTAEGCKRGVEELGRSDVLYQSRHNLNSLCLFFFRKVAVL